MLCGLPPGLRNGREIARAVNPVGRLRKVAVDAGENRGGRLGHLRTKLGLCPIGVEIRRAKVVALRPAGLDGLDLGVQCGVPAVLVPGGLGQGRDVGAQDPRPPVDAHQARAAVGRARRPRLSASGRPKAAAWRPGSSSIQGMAHFGRPDLGEAGLDRRVAHRAADATHGHRLGERLVEEGRLLRRAEHPAAGGQGERGPRSWRRPRSPRGSRPASRRSAAG